MDWLGKTMVCGLFITSTLFMLGCTEQINSNSTYTLQDLGEHNSPNDCWVAIDGNVYDITQMIASFQANVPNQFVNYCGVDATAALQSKGFGGPDFNGTRTDFNSQGFDFNRVRSDNNIPRQDFNGARPNREMNSSRGFSQYYIGKLIS
ncbi:MAG: cytochrome b5-like heme/steroid binding domain-containing protein [archaeon]|jgi:predicted heme/steroid binding protein